MRKTALTIVLAMMAALTGLAGCDEKKAGPDYKAGQTFGRKVTLKSNLMMMFPNSDNKATEMTLGMKVLAVDDGGVAAVQVTVESIKADYLTLGRKFNFDSEADPAKVAEPANATLASQQEKFSSAFKDLKGQQYTARVNKKGEVIELKDLDARLKSLAYESAKADMLGGDQVRMLFTESNLKDYVSPVLAQGITQSKDNETIWSAPGSIFVPYCPLIGLDKTYVLDRKNKNEAGEIVAPFKVVKAEQQPATSPYHAGSSFEVTACSGEGNVYYSAKTHHIVRIHEKITVGVRSAATPPRLDKDGNKRPEARIEYIVDKLIEAR